MIIKDKTYTTYNDCLICELIDEIKTINKGINDLTFYRVRVLDSLYSKYIDYNHIPSEIDVITKDNPYEHTHNIFKKGDIVYVGHIINLPEFSITRLSSVIMKESLNERITVNKNT